MHTHTPCTCAVLRRVALAPLHPPPFLRTHSSPYTHAGVVCFCVTPGTMCVCVCVRVGDSTQTVMLVDWTGKGSAPRTCKLPSRC